VNLLSEHMAEHASDAAVALRRKVDFVGKTNKKSKVMVFWAFQGRKGSCFRHEVKMTYSSMSGKRRIWFNGKLIHDSRNFNKKTAVPHKYKWEGGGYQLECLSLKNSTNYKINLIVDGTPFIKLPRRSQNISLEDIFQKRRMCRVDGSWGENSAIAIGCTSEHLGKRLAGSKRKIQYFFVFVDSPETEHVVEIKYSILSGKRQLSVDGVQVHKSQRLQMTLQFKHAFKAIGHMFEMLVQEKSDMILTRLCIDGMDYRRLPLVTREQMAVALEKRAKRTASMGDDEIDEDMDDDIDIDIEEDEDAKEDDDEDDDDDDDAEDEEEEEDAAPAAAAAAAAPAGPQRDAGDDLLADLFGDMPSSATPAAGASAGAFDPFAAAPAAAAAGFDPFGQAPAAFDPFGAAPAPQQRQQQQQQPAPSTSLSDLFGAVAVSNTRAPAAAAQSQDPRQMRRFDAAPPAAPAAFDPFGNLSAAPQQVSQPPPAADPFAGF